MATTATHPSLLSATRAIVLATAMMALAACGESPVAPRQSPIDRAAAARVVPAVIDARIRLALGIDNQAVRDRLSHDLQELETALNNGDGDKARFHLRVISTVTADYKAQQGPMATDRAEICAVDLMTLAVTKALDNSA